jgi:3-methylfumaryl-CoA hydratase
MNGTRLADLQRWIGRGEAAEEVLSPLPARRLAATLDLPAAHWPGAQLPPLWHVLYFLDGTPTEELADDGTARDLPLLPPVEAEQMLWLGADYRFGGPLQLDATTRRESRVAAVSAHRGSRGAMVFVTLEHRYLQQGALRVQEQVHLAFLPAAQQQAAPHVAAPPCTTVQRWTLSETLLFRFAALTFDTHRIHYDQHYATRAAGFPGLVVQGPLQALLMSETLRAQQPHEALRSARFRAHAPLFCTGAELRICAGRGGAAAQHRLWTESASGGMALQGCLGF